MNDLRRQYNPIVDLSKFTSNKKILSKVVTLILKLQLSLLPNCLFFFFPLCFLKEKMKLAGGPYKSMAVLPRFFFRLIIMKLKLYKI